MLHLCAIVSTDRILNTNHFHSKFTLLYNIYLDIYKYLSRIIYIYMYIVHTYIGIYTFTHQRWMLADAHMLRNSPRATKLAELPRHSHMPVLGRQLQCSALAQHHLQQGMYMEFIWNVYGMYMACKWNVYGMYIVLPLIVFHLFFQALASHLDQRIHMSEDREKEKEE